MDKKRILEGIVRDYNVTKEEVIRVYYVCNYKKDLREIKDNRFDSYMTTIRYFRRYSK